MGSWYVTAGPGGDAPAPGDDRGLELADLGKLARRGVRAVTRAARADEQVTFSSLLRGHLGGAADGDVVEETWPGYEHVNVQAGLDAWLTAGGRGSETVGVLNFRHQHFGLAELLTTGDQPHAFGLRPGNAATVNLPSGPDGATRPCLRCALVLTTDGDVRTALLVRGAEPESGLTRVSVQALSTDPGAARAAVRDIRAAADRENVFRGQVLSFDQEVFGHGQTLLQFHRRPQLASGQLVLPAGTLAEIERQVVDVARHKARLLAAGQHLKRGLLLYGPPGAGKTHTVRFLVSRLPGTTVVQLTGGALHLIAQAPSRGSHRAREV